MICIAFYPSIIYQIKLVDITHIRLVFHEGSQVVYSSKEINGCLKLSYQYG
jgi:hypothetical protein